MPQSVKRVYNYKLTVNDEYWAKQLKKIGLKLTKKDRKIFNSVRNEKSNNESMARILSRALKDGLYIPSLTKLEGNCMFESMQLAGLCPDHIEFRQAVALLFFLFGDCKILSAYKESTLKEIFEFFRDTEYVFCHDTNLLFRYTYYTMCSDMSTPRNWSRLPTELILTVISIFFKVRIHIYHDNGHVDKICDVDLEKKLPNNDDKCNIYLALIGENHYVPLVRVPRKRIDTIKCPKYDIALKEFHKWARKRANVIGLYNDVITYSDSESETESESENESDAESDKNSDTIESREQQSHNQSNNKSKLLSNSNKKKTQGVDSIIVPPPNQNNKAKNPIDISSAPVIHKHNLPHNLNNNEDLYNNFRVKPFTQKIAETHIKSSTSTSEREEPKRNNTNNLVFFQ